MRVHFELVYQNGNHVIEAARACGIPYDAQDGQKHTHDIRKVNCRACVDRLIQILEGIKGATS